MSQETPSTPPSSQTWNWQRFACLAVAHWAEQRRHYLGYLLVLAILYAVLLLLTLGVSSFKAFDAEVQAAFYFSGLFLTGYVFAGRYFDGIAQRESALLILMRPASVLEKWALCVLVVGVLYPLAYSALFLLMSWPVLQLVVFVRPLISEGVVSLDKYFLFVPWWPHGAEHAVISLRAQMGLWIALWAGQAFVLAGTLYFRKAGMLKALVVGFALFVLTALWIVVTGARTESLFVWWSLDAEVFTPWLHGLNALVWIVVPGLLWGLVYVNLQEKEQL